MAYGDFEYLPLYLYDAAGAPLAYANLTAATTAGWSFTWRDKTDTALASPPTLTLASTNATTGRHKLTFNLPTVDAVLYITPPSALHRSVPADYVYSDTTNNPDDIVNLLTISVGTPLAASSISTYDITVAEGDSLSVGIAYPLTSLAAWGFTNLTDAAWTVTGAVRETTDDGTGTPVPLQVQITDTVAGLLNIGWGTFPTGLNLQPSDVLTGSRDRRYDVQAVRTDNYAITAAVAGAGGTLTIAGDLRKRFTTGATITVTGGANAGTWTVASIALISGNTRFTVTGTLPSSVAGGTIAATLRVTGIRGTLKVVRQEDRT